MDVYQLLYSSIPVLFITFVGSEAFFYERKRKVGMIPTRAENRGKGNSAKGKEVQKPVTTVALDRVCVRV